MTVGDCFKSICIEELVRIGSPYEDLRKSSTSCVMVTSPKKYFRPRFASPRRKEAVSSDFIIHHASSMSTIRRLSSFLIAFQMKRIIMYIAADLSSSSMSRSEKTIKLELISMFDG